VSRKCPEAIGTEHVPKRVAKHFGPHPVFAAPKEPFPEIQGLLEELQKRENPKRPEGRKNDRKAKPPST
jgi:hypothetical protein